MVRLNMESYDNIYSRRLKRPAFDIRPSDLDSKKPDFKRLKTFPSVEHNYVWFVEFLFEPDEQTEVIRSEDRNENENIFGNGNVKEYEVVGVDVDENDKDPDYCLFLKNLTEHGKSYKLNISQRDDEPRFLYYEELQTCIDTIEDLQINQKAERRPKEKNRKFSTKKNVSRRKRIDDHKCVTQPSELVAVKLEEDIVDYETNATGSDSDSDVVILDNVLNCSKADDKQPLLTEKESALKEKLMHVLKQPYNEKEYEELSDYIEQKKPLRRHLDLRGRPMSSAFGGAEKSLLDTIPGSFRCILNAARNDPPKALNLLRMICFWLEHLPNEDAFAPWEDKCILRVRPRE